VPHPDGNGATVAKTKGAGLTPPATPAVEIEMNPVHRGGDKA
jgi:hypothetical protein